MTDDLEPTETDEWIDLLEDADTIAETYRERGWDVIVLEPEAVSPSEADDRFGFDAVVSDAEYDLLESLVDGGDVTIDDAEVYYRPADGADRRYALAVERDSETEAAVCVPLTYSIDEARPVLETALVEEELLLHVRPDEADPDRWVSFSHADPSLFLEESDVRGWSVE